MPGLKKLASKLSIGKTGVNHDNQQSRHDHIRRQDSDKGAHTIAATCKDGKSKMFRPIAFRRGQSLGLDDHEPVPEESVSPVLGFDYNSMECASILAASVLGSSVSVDKADLQQGNPITSRFNKKGWMKESSSKPPRLQPIDNFKKWDSATVRHTRSDGVHGSASLGVPAIDPFRETVFTQMRWAAGQELLVDSDEDVPIPHSRQVYDSHQHDVIQPLSSMKMSEIDWSKFDDEQVSEYIMSLNTGPLIPSPVDSAIDMPTQEVPLLGKGKARAVEIKPDVREARRRTSRLPGQWPDVERDDTMIESTAFDVLLAKDLALKEEIERAKETMKQMQMQWEDRIAALKLEKEQLLERKHQEEEDRRTAQELEEQFIRECLEEERLAAERERLARLKDCVVCGDTKDSLEFQDSAATSDCEHDSDTCRECMESWMSSELDTKGVEDIKCPQCPAKLSYDDVHRAASDATFLAYEKLLTRNALAALPEFAWCLSSTCDSGQLNEENEHFMDCAACGYKQCLRHKVAWHTGETCEQYEYRSSGQKARDEEAATEAMLDEVSKKCPGMNCGWRIQKIDGCDHMTCKRCRFEFCWECLASHKQIKQVGNTAHQSWCKFHSDNLKISWPFNVH